MTISRQYLTLSCLGLISLVFWARSLLTTFSLGLGNDAYTHILLILPVSVALIFLLRNSILDSTRSNFAVGGALLALAAVIGGLSRWEFAASSSDIALSLNMTALVTWWIASVIFCLGTRVFRIALFPLLFMYCLVPFPGILLNQIVSVLQKTSALLTGWFFAAAGVPVSLNGIVLSIPGIDIEVAKECSSIRSSLMLMVASMVLAHLFLRSSWRKAVVIAVAVPLSVIKNAVRIFTLTMLATNVDPGFLTGRLHHQGGVVFFLLALGAICALIWLLQGSESTTAPSSTSVRTTPDPAASR